MKDPSIDYSDISPLDDSFFTKETATWPVTRDDDTEESYGRSAWRMHSCVPCSGSCEHLTQKMTRIEYISDGTVLTRGLSA